MPKPALSEDATAASGQEPAMGTAEPPLAAQDATVTKAAEEPAEAAAEPVAKADGEKTPMQAVFDQDGDLIGIVNPDAIQPVTGAGKQPPPRRTPMRPAADDGDMTPAPPADAGTPADAVADDGTVTKQDAGCGSGAQEHRRGGSGGSARRAGPGAGRRQAG